MADEREMSTRGFEIAIFGVVVLLCCGVPISGVYLTRKDARDEPGMRAAGDAYLAAIVRRDYGTAYDLLCEADRRRESRATWLARASDSGPTGFRITDVTVERSSDTPTLRAVFAEVTYASGPTRKVRLHVERQAGDWKVCSPAVR
ncbi:hypothetical protein MRQ36_22810 [Micromonospora sp. R77]|uniref:Rv0361 family membrane protein n=1 Tax=Micromonospora sp. R77 TaxID=2925836 RepID=UPI001F5FF614|nr:hypothetical protein [Micromonospora sp. R77]MCI4065241.1 hypothetical protein [Micromonospora sp. R77]